MVNIRSIRLIVPLTIVQIVFLIIFGLKIEYHETAKAVDTVKPSTASGLYPSKQMPMSIHLHLPLCKVGVRFYIQNVLAISIK